MQNANLRVPIFPLSGKRFLSTIKLTIILWLTVALQSKKQE